MDNLIKDPKGLIEAQNALTDLTVTGSRCLCRECGGLFNTTAAFDAHRKGKYMPMERHCDLSKMFVSDKGYIVAKLKVVA